MTEYCNFVFTESFDPIEGIPGIRVKYKEIKDPVDLESIENEMIESEEGRNAYKNLHSPVRIRRILDSPLFVFCSTSAADELKISSTSFQRNILYVTGSNSHVNATSFASNYSGHQYGLYTVLGDGRTVTIGKEHGYCFQMRGIGSTPINPKKDGLLPLPTCIHEFLIAEALHKLRVPTSRALCVGASMTPTYYENNPNPFLSGVITRFAPSWIRFGTFEYLYYRGEHTKLKELADFVIEKFYPDILDGQGKEILESSTLISGKYFNTESESVDGCNLAGNVDLNTLKEALKEPITVELNHYAVLFRRVIARTANLVAHWQVNGFVHGLLNTENFSILGITVHFEESGFMDSYDPQWTPNPHESRYRFENQPMNAKWALSRFGQTLVNLIGENMTSSNSRPRTKGSDMPWMDGELPKSGKPSIPSRKKVPFGFLYNSSKAENIVRELLRDFDMEFDQRFGELFMEKLGVNDFVKKDYEVLITPLLDLLAQTGTDYTKFFRAIGSFSCSADKYPKEIQFDPKGEHSPAKLRSSKQTSCLGIILKSLQLLIDADIKCIENEIKNLKREGINVFLPGLAPILEDIHNIPDGYVEIETLFRSLNVDEFPQLKRLPYPTLEEAATQWKFWTLIYKARLYPNPKTSDAEIIQRDKEREAHLKNINPKYCLKRYLIRNALKEIHENTPNLAMKIADPDPKKKQEPIETPKVHLDKIPIFDKARYLNRLMIDDMYGTVADSFIGWNNEELTKITNSWTGITPPENSNLTEEILQI